MSSAPDADLTYPHSVYRLFTADGTLLYIGCAYDVEHRVYMHRATYTMGDAAWVIHRHYDHHASQEYPTKVAARAAERKAIHDDAPILNRQHNPKRWRRVTGQYVPVDAETARLMDELLAAPEPDPELVAFFASYMQPATP